MPTQIPVRVLLSASLLCLATGCVFGNQIRADAEVIQNDIEKAKRSGAMRCAPRELATAVAELDFINGELMQGNSFRAHEHAMAAKAAVQTALTLSKDCGPKQILVREREPTDTTKKPPVVVRIEQTDEDNDKILDTDDKCPNKPEDKDGFEDEDGCPEPDNDNDGVLDGNDKCPVVPGPLANQGCPVETPKDGDNDGVVDSMDKCPSQAEDKDGFQDDDGCVDSDNDGDGLSDGIDKCPNDKGDITNGGCPLKDADADGIVDEADKCPREPEDKDGFQDGDGCPDLDNDGDGIPDSVDECDDAKGTMDNKGCPAQDHDGDGILDGDDQCPDKAGTQARKGCPAVDRDQDGIPDDEDKCPEQAGAAVTNGCPITDKDQDGIEDAKDRCPLDEEDKDGFKDDDGCPDNDNDQDGQPDKLDKCPDAAGPLQNQGCPVTDRDGDGIDDDKDKCPGQAEDKDGFEDDDGCLDADNDKDGIPDAQDKCPMVAGAVEAFGCADVDTDGDGVVDRLDKCPNQAEDKDGFEDKDGCADPDNDGDGVLDADDKCPDVAGTKEGGGCADKDSDGDGIVDRLDKCADQFGRTEDGCPKKYKMVVVQKDRIQITKQIKFGTSSAKIIGGESFAIIREVAQALKDNPQIKKLRVEGHTDSVGNDATNLRLSQKRADAVMAALIQAGIDPERLVAVGFGETQPIASNSSKGGRAENRRTEFNIVEQ